MGKFDIPVKNATWNEVKNLKSCVYVMGNTYMKGFLKVGYTNRELGHLGDRVKEQYKNQWVLPNSLKCIFIVETDQPELLEHKMHNDPDMAETRESDKRELFTRDINDLFSELYNHSKGIATCIYAIENEFEEFGVITNPLIFTSNNQVNNKQINPELASGEYVHIHKKSGQQIILKYNKESDTWQLRYNNTWSEPYSKSKMFNGYKGESSVLRKHGFRYNFHTIINELRKIN